MTTRVASANLLYTLPPTTASAALDEVLAGEPDLVALQEWYLPRLGILRRWGGVRLATLGVLPSVPVPAARAPRYHWVATVDGNVVGARADRYDLVRARAHLNIGPAPSERKDRFLRTEPPRFVAVGVFRDLRSGRLATLLSYHLSAGVQSRGSYRSDRPRLAERHRHEVAHLQTLVSRELDAGRTVHAAGDSNFHGMQLAGVTSAWVGREDEPGTHGRGKRKIDDVLGPGPATEVRRITTASDHQAIVVTRPD